MWFKEWNIINVPCLDFAPVAWTFFIVRKENFTSIFLSAGKQGNQPLDVN